LQNSISSFRDLYDKAYKYGNEKTKKELNQIAEKWKKNAEQMQRKEKEIEK
jgi:hypothetical protein